MRVDRDLYSHCPLKKRPVLFFQDLPSTGDESNGTSEPENLSTKPEDLRLSSKYLNSFTRGAVNSGNIKVSVEERASPSGFAGEYLVKECPEHLEEPSINNAVNNSFRVNPSLSWHRPLYPAHVNQYSFPSDVYSHHYTTRVLTDQGLYQNTTRDHSPCYLIRQNVSPSIKPIGEHYQLNEFSRYSPSPSPSKTSSSNCLFLTTPSPPTTPEELLSPGSVSSSGGSSAGSTGYGNGVKYICPSCSKSYSTISGLTKHYQFHCVDNKDSAPKKSFSCTSCEKVYVSLGALKMHIRTHTLPCKCNICGKAFSRPWLLQGHIRTHTGEKPFCCPLCNRAFADRSNLRAHLQTHSEVKKYSCSSCGKTFSRMSLLTKHLDCGCLGPGLSSEDLIT